MSYRRVFDASGSDSLAKLARWIPPGSAVLELGAATGYFTAALRERGCTVDVVEVDADAAREAASHARNVVVADLEGSAWVDRLGGVRYRAIVCADVLEHLRDGAALLARLAPMLERDGELLLSVPNVAHSAVIASLFDDRFDYGGEGLLDPTHLRLYTWRSLSKLLRETGYGIREWDATTLSAFDTEFRVRIESLPAPLRDALERRPRGLVYQWLVRAAPDVVDRAPDPPVLGAAENVPVRLLYAADADALSLDGSLVAGLPVGAGPCPLEWRIPSPSRALRLLLADRPGVIQVLDCRLLQGEDILWTLAGEEGLECAPTVVRLDATTFALAAPDGWIAPAVAPEMAARADRFVATLAWPDSVAEQGGFGVLAALAGAYRANVDATGRLRDELLAAVESHRRAHAEEAAAHAAARTANEELTAALARRDAEVAHLAQAVDGYRTENARLDAALAAQERIIAYRQSLRWWLKLPVVRVKLWWHRLRNLTG